MTKKCMISIDYCNNTCPHFYFKYEDRDNIWCGKLNKMIFDGAEECFNWFDSKPREIPKECPLEDL